MEDPNLTAEQRDKTIDLMVKLLGRHIQDAKQDAKELNKFFKETETKIHAFEKELKREEMQVMIDDIKRKKAIAQKEIEESLASAEMIKLERDPVAEDCIIDNEILLAEVDNILGKGGRNRTYDSEDEDLS